MMFFTLCLPLVSGGLVFALKNNAARNIILLCAALAHLACVVFFWILPPAAALGGFLALDSIGLLVLSIISILFFAVSLYLPGYVQNEGNPSNRVLNGCLLFLLFSMTLVTVSQHLGLFWVAIASTTLMTAPLVSFHRSPEALEATWKYLLISSVGIALALLGTFFVAISAIGVKSLRFADLLAQAPLLSVPWLKLGVIFLVVGYGTKLGLVPMHGWKPDTYGEAPGPVGALLSGGLTQCAFLAFLRMTQLCRHAGQMDFFQPILLALGLLSIGLAALFMLGQVDFNRLLAYSSIEHMGILVLGIGLGGLGFYGSLYHAVNNSLSKALIFLVSANLYQKYRSKKIGDIRGVLHVFPFTGGFLIMAFLAVTGIPPFGTFFSELMILNAALASRHYVLAFFYLFFLAVIFIAMASVVLKMAQGSPEGAYMEAPGKEFRGRIIPLLLLTGLALFLGLFIPSFLDRALQASGNLLGGP